MLLHIGLTGGIGAGKSTVAAIFAELGAQIIDADKLAHEVLEPGSSALAEIGEVFGSEFINSAGELERGALGAYVFNNPEQLKKLNAIVHPAVAKLTKDRVAELPADAVIVHDVPLIAENDLKANYHLVFVAQCPQQIRMDRLTQERGMSLENARSRIAAQANDEQRRKIADALIPTHGSIETTRAAVEKLWQERVLPMQRNMMQNTRSPHSPQVRLLPNPPEPRSWQVQAQQLMDRIIVVLKDVGLQVGTDFTVDHIGSTAIGGIWAKDVLDVQLQVINESAQERISQALIAGGFPGQPAFDYAKSGWPAGAGNRVPKMFHANADPAREVHIHIRAVDSLAASYALNFVKLHRQSLIQRDRYAQLKAQLLRTTANRAEYADRKEAYFDDVWPAIAQLLTEAEVT